jgi:predicted metalloprotease with PDZ domain
MLLTRPISHPERIQSMKSASRITLLLMMACAVPAPHFAVQSPSSDASAYTVTISLTDPPAAEVRADVTIRDGRLYMIGGAVDHLARGWGDFVRDLRVTGADGESLRVEEHGDDRYKAQWRVGDGYQGRARLTYRVDLSFAKTKWPAGNEQAAYFDGKALFAASRVLFVVSTGDAPAEVRFEIPPGAKLATPWDEVPGRHAFRTSGPDLLNNSLVVGAFGGLEAREGNFQFTVALLGEANEARPVVAGALSKFARAYGALFPDTPPSTYLMTIFFADAEDGEAYNRSAAFTTQPRLGEENLILWGNTLGHELFHYWCGQQIQGEVYEESQWFQEGFTEYYSNLALVRERILPERLFVWKAENNLGKYLYFRSAPQFSKVSIRDAGKMKTTHRFGVYDGGWAVAFALDLAIRERTAGRRSLDDFMRRMYQKFGLTGIRFKYADVVATASEVAGADLSDFFKRYVEGVETLPIASLLKKVGYGSSGQDYAAELYLYPLEPTPLKSEWLRLR